VCATTHKRATMTPQVVDELCPIGDVTDIVDCCPWGSGRASSKETRSIATMSSVSGWSARLARAWPDRMVQQALLLR